MIQMEDLTPSNSHRRLLFQIQLSFWVRIKLKKTAYLRKSLHLQKQLFVDVFLNRCLKNFAKADAFLWILLTVNWCTYCMCWYLMFIHRSSNLDPICFLISRGWPINIRMPIILCYQYLNFSKYLRRPYIYHVYFCM